MNNTRERLKIMENAVSKPIVPEKSFQTLLDLGIIDEYGEVTEEYGRSFSKKKHYARFNKEDLIELILTEIERNIKKEDHNVNGYDYPLNLDRTTVQSSIENVISCYARIVNGRLVCENKYNYTIKCNNRAYIISFSPQPMKVVISEYTFVDCKISEINKFKK